MKQKLISILFTSVAFFLISIIAEYFIWQDAKSNFFTAKYLITKALTAIIFGVFMTLLGITNFYKPKINKQSDNT